MCSLSGSTSPDLTDVSTNGNRCPLSPGHLCLKVPFLDRLPVGLSVILLRIVPLGSLENSILALH